MQYHPAQCHTHVPSGGSMVLKVWHCLTFKQILPKGDRGRHRETEEDKGRQRETEGDRGRQRETKRDKGRQRETEGDI